MSILPGLILPLLSGGTFHDFSITLYHLGRLGFLPFANLLSIFWPFWFFPSVYAPLEGITYSVTSVLCECTTIYYLFHYWGHLGLLFWVNPNSAAYSHVLVNVCPQFSWELLDHGIGLLPALENNASVPKWLYQFTPFLHQQCMWVPVSPCPYNTYHRFLILAVLVRANVPYVFQPFLFWRHSNI